MNMYINIAAGLLIPFLGTILGSACVFFMKEELNATIQKSLLGFASGVMVAASVWSLLIPAMEMSEWMDKMAFLPAAVGLALGFAFLLFLDMVIPHMHLDSDQPEGIGRKDFTKSIMLLLAVTLHNIPEGMAVGVVLAGAVSGSATVTFASAMSLAVGIAIQNFPEGAIISMPLKNTGISKARAFLFGTLSGAVEPVGAILVILLTRFLVPVLPYMLAFAAGAMLYVVVEELIPEASEGPHSNAPTINFAIGFIVMMVLDVVLG